MRRHYPQAPPVALSSIYFSRPIDLFNFRFFFAKLHLDFTSTEIPMRFWSRAVPILALRQDKLCWWSTLR
jgi:hypothetical protein